MNWNEAGNRLSQLYGIVSAWVDANPVETDLIIVSVVVGSLLLYTNRARRMRRKAHLVLWGSLMNPKHREKLQKMRFEDAIVDCAMEMVASGEMTEEQERRWYAKMSKQYGLVGLLPIRDQASVKRGIRYRLRTLFGLKQSKFPGSNLPGPEIDQSYKPNSAPEMRGLNTSKYLTEA